MLSDLAFVAAKLDFPQTSDWSLDQIRSRRTQIEALADSWTEIGRVGRPHPWEGFEPKPFVPGDDEAAGRIVEEAAQHFQRLMLQVQECGDLLGQSELPRTTDILESVHRLKAVPEPPRQFMPDCQISSMTAIREASTANKRSIGWQDGWLRLGSCAAKRI